MAILFILFLPATIVLGLYLSAYAAHSFLVVVEGTAAGNDEVVWPDEPFLESFWKNFYLVWLAGVWLLPISLLTRLLTGPLSAETRTVTMLLMAGGALWLMFPLSLLSSLSGNSRWVIFRPALLPRLAGCCGAVLAFYAVTGLLLGSSGVVIFLTMCQGGVFLLPVTAPAGAAALLIYARLLGRLACQLTLVPMTPPKQPQRRKKVHRTAKKSVATDPWAVPAAAEGSGKAPPIVLPLDGPIEEYEIAMKPTAPPLPPILGYDRIHDPRPTPVPSPEEQEAKKTKPPPIILPLDGPIDGYDMEEKSSLPPLPSLLGYDPVSGRPQLAGASAEQRATEPLPRPAQRLFEERLAEASEGQRAPSPLLPPQLLLHGVFTFPWYRTSLTAWVWLSLGNLLLGVLIQLLVLFGSG